MDVYKAWNNPPCGNYIVFHRFFNYKLPNKAIRDLEYKQEFLRKTVVDAPALLETLSGEEPYAIIDLIWLLVKRITVYQTSKAEIQYNFSPSS